jgi:predicted SAM-dependent methyltransferase
MIKILDVGSGVGSVAEKVFDWLPEKQITRLDIDPQVNPDIVHDIANPLPEEMNGQYDIVYISHVLEHVDRARVIEAFRNVIGAVRNMGEVWVVVPSMEWAANEIINKREGIHVQMNIFGAQHSPFDVHRTGFTLISLRQVVELCGLIVRRAYQSPFTIEFEGRQYNSLQNVVIGARYDELNDPANAIESVNEGA